MSSQLMYRRAAEELRAAAFHRACTLRRVLSALAAHVTREKLRQWEHQEVAEKHSRRSASLTVTLAVLRNFTWKSNQINAQTSSSPLRV